MTVSRALLLSQVRHPLLAALFLAASAACASAALAESPRVGADPAQEEVVPQERSAVAAAISRTLSDQLQAAYPGSKVRLTSGFTWTRGQDPTAVSNVILVRETPLGEAQIIVRAPEGDIEGRAFFVAEARAWVPVRRVLPGEELKSGDLRLQDVVVSQGMAREYRGLLLPADSDVGALEARQTLLEGQFILASAVRKVPDAKRGDTLRVQMRSGDVVLSTSGTAEEPAYLDGPIRVMVQKSKRSLSGKLVAKGIVEVRL